MITTNERVGALHPAVSRAGRCALAHEFDRLPVDDANAWLTACGATPTVTRPTTIADLYAIRDGRERGGTSATLGFVGTRLNPSIRRLLREETALKLSGASDADDRTSVPVRLVPGAPRRLAGRRFDDVTGLGVTLAPYQHTLRRVQASLDALEPALSALMARTDGRAIVGDRASHVAPVRELTAHLLAEATKADLVRWAR